MVQYCELYILYFKEVKKCHSHSLVKGNLASLYLSNKNQQV